MADIDLPVLPFRINWREGINERLLFRTTLLKGEEGAEQRFSTRLTPRRQIETDFLLSGPERTFYDLFIHRHSASEFMAPLYWDVGITTAVLTAALTDRIDFDTRWTEFMPGLAILQRDSAMVFEVIEIVAVDDNGLDLADPVVNTWPKRTRVMPLRRTLLDDMGSMTQHSAEVASISAQLGIVVANHRVLPDDESTVYSGLPVFLQESNWVEALDVGLARDMVRLDNETGLPFQRDPTGRANIGQAHRWLLKNRAEQAALRDFLYLQDGRRGAFWLPTFKGDLKLSSAVLSAATQLVVKNAGLVYTEVPISGREHIAIFPRGDDPILREIVSTINGTTIETEKVNLGSSVGQDLSTGQVRKISFLDTAHFDQDEFEINHLSSTVAEMTAAFRTFKNTRDPSGPIYYPIPPAEMTPGECGQCVTTYVSEIVLLSGGDDGTGFTGYYYLHTSPDRSKSVFADGNTSNTRYLTFNNERLAYNAQEVLTNDLFPTETYVTRPVIDNAGNVYFTSRMGDKTYKIEPDLTIVQLGTDNDIPVTAYSKHYLRQLYNVDGIDTLFYINAATNGEDTNSIWTRPTDDSEEPTEINSFAETGLTFNTEMATFVQSDNGDVWVTIIEPTPVGSFPYQIVDTIYFWRVAGSASVGSFHAVTMPEINWAYADESQVSAHNGKFYVAWGIYGNVPATYLVRVDQDSFAPEGSVNVTEALGLDGSYGSFPRPYFGTEALPIDTLRNQAVYSEYTATGDIKVQRFDLSSLSLATQTVEQWKPTELFTSWPDKPPSVDTIYDVVYYPQYSVWHDAVGGMIALPYNFSTSEFPEDMAFLYIDCLGGEEES